MKNAKTSPETSFDLNNIRIASPCHEDWSKMKGDDRSRHCAACKLNVFNVSEMSKSEAEKMILGRLGKERVCVKLMRRHDGTIITKDCPVGVSRIRMLRMKVASLAFSVFAGVFTAMGSSNRAHGRGELMGKVAAPIAPSQTMGGISPMMGDISQPEMGEMVALPTPTPSPTPVPHYENDGPYHFEE